MEKPVFITVPHSGERIPPEARWLKDLPERVQMCDVDRYVDQLYGPAIEKHHIPHVISEWHRYSGDLNRLPEDIDQDSVVGAENPSGSHTTGLFWVKTTKGETLMPEPVAMETYRKLVAEYHRPFHESVEKMYQSFFEKGAQKVYQIDCHSMPSMGTAAHRDPGEKRAQVVISDREGNSCEGSFLDLVVESFRSAGFEVKTNWPYVGGRVTETYGKPELGQHCIQVELNRELYMDETTKQKKAKEFAVVQESLEKAVSAILDGIG